MEYSVVLVQRPRHAGCHGHTVPVLEGPHAVQVKEGHSVAVLENLVEIGLEAGHGAQVPIDEGYASLFRGERELVEKITDSASRRKIHVQVGMMLTGRIAPVACQGTV
jgi:hypothetical protein